MKEGIYLISLLHYYVKIRISTEPKSYLPNKWSTQRNSHTQLRIENQVKMPQKENKLETTLGRW
jgi:hypothetical protein